MRCWKCGQELTEGAAVCIYCGEAQRRADARSPEGKALRALYDRYGRDAVLKNSAILTNGLGDLLADSGKLRGQLKMALDAGAGRMLLDCLDGAGKPDASFDARFKTLLTEEADLSDKAAGELAGFFDEMIGWRDTLRIQNTPNQPAQQQVSRPKEIPRPVHSTQSKEIRRTSNNAIQEQERGVNVTPLPLIDSPIPQKPKGKAWKVTAIIFLLLAIAAVITSLRTNDDNSQPSIVLFVAIALLCFYISHRKAIKPDGQVLTLRRMGKNVVCEWKSQSGFLCLLAVNDQWLIRGATNPMTLYDVPQNATITLATEMNGSLSYVDRGTI